MNSPLLERDHGITKPAGWGIKPRSLLPRKAGGAAHPAGGSVRRPSCHVAVQHRGRPHPPSCDARDPGPPWSAASSPSCWSKCWSSLRPWPWSCRPDGGRTHRRVLVGLPFLISPFGRLGLLFFDDFGGFATSRIVHNGLD